MWPFLLGHYQFGMTEAERKEVGEGVLPCVLAGVPCAPMGSSVSRAHPVSPLWAGLWVELGQTLGSAGIDRAKLATGLCSSSCSVPCAPWEGREDMEGHFSTQILATFCGSGTAQGEGGCVPRAAVHTNVHPLCGAQRGWFGALQGQPFPAIVPLCPRLTSRPGRATSTRWQSGWAVRPSSGSARRNPTLLPWPSAPRGPAWTPTSRG